MEGKKKQSVHFHLLKQKIRAEPDPVPEHRNTICVICGRYIKLIFRNDCSKRSLRFTKLLLKHFNSDRTNGYKWGKENPLKIVEEWLQ